MFKKSIDRRLFDLIYHNLDKIKEHSVSAYVLGGTRHFFRLGGKNVEVIDWTSNRVDFLGYLMYVGGVEDGNLFEYKLNVSETRIGKLYRKLEDKKKSDDPKEKILNEMKYNISYSVI